MNRKVGAVFALFTAVAAAGCASTPESEANNDPLEPMNRAIFNANDKLDEAVALPVAKAYVKVVPEPVRTGVHNVIANLDTPVTFANDVLQGDFSRAAESLFRFSINSTFGLAGLIDVGAKADVPAHTEDFGQTLGVYGVHEGPYLVLPLLGPSNPRDAIGEVADIFMDPLTYMRFHGRNAILISKEVLTVVDERADNIDNIQQIKDSSVDYYATTRSLYRQHRNSEISNGKAPTNDLPDL
ncbi:MAG TPA: VacJ family lipoprotein [Rhizomicrobium sp.]